jgi:hypothetical protein
VVFTDDALGGGVARWACACVVVKRVARPVMGVPEGVLEEHLIFLSGVEIHTRVELILGALDRCVGNVVVGQTAVGGYWRFQLKDLQRCCVKRCLRSADDVRRRPVAARERRSGRRVVENLSRWIRGGDCRGCQRRKVAGELCCRRYGGCVEPARGQRLTLETEEEEKLVFDQRTTRIGAVLVLMQWRPREPGVIAEVVVRIQHGVAEVLVQRAMQLVRPLLGRDLHNTTGKAAELRRHIAGRNAELLHGILRRNERVNVVLWDIREHAVNEEQALAAEATTDLIVAVGYGLRLAASLEVARSAVCHRAALGVRSGHNAWDEVEKIVDVAPV